MNTIQKHIKTSTFIIVIYILFFSPFQQQKSITNHKCRNLTSLEVKVSPGHTQIGTGGPGEAKLQHFQEPLGNCHKHDVELLDSEVRIPVSKKERVMQFWRQVILGVQ
jgi:hypothetical protein